MVDEEVDRDEYTSAYIAEHQDKEYSFEAILSEVRRDVEIECIQDVDPEYVLEVGCGLDPLFEHVNNYDRYTVVEPSKEFAQRATAAANHDNRVEVVNARLEEATDRLTTAPDIVVLSSLLHEVPNPDELLESVREVAGPGTTVHINVPNVRSFHRLLAYEMGLIDRIDATSQIESQFQRHSHFDEGSLRNIVKRNGFEVTEFETYFIKPFSNEQMEAILRVNIVDDSVIEGLANMTEYLPDLGAEMYVMVVPENEQ